MIKRGVMIDLSPAWTDLTVLSLICAGVQTQQLIKQGGDEISKQGLKYFA